jgi:hypothetical protein
MPPLLDRAAVYAAVRSADAKMDMKDPPPKLGSMSAAEFAEYTKQFGFHPLK